MVKLQVLRQSFIEKIDDSYVVDFLLKGILKVDNTKLLILFADDLDEKTENLLNEKFKEVLNGIPVQYVVGRVEFYGREFEVDKRVLIPRFETAELIDYVLEQKTDFKNILDIGTGSGILAITLKKEILNSEVTASDISTDALAVAKKNAEKNAAKIKFTESDLMENISGKFDLVVSNPPYIAKGDLEVERIVAQNEPELALFAGSDGLDIYRKLIPELVPHLNNDALVIFEIGYKQADAIKEMVREINQKIKVEVIKDFYGKDRFVAFRWKP